MRISKVIMSLKTCLLLTGMMFANQAAAEIHRWVDEHGKVHYGDQRKKTTNSEAVVIKDKYVIPYIEKKAPIAYQQEEKNRLVSISSIVLDMPRSETEEVRIGRITCGRATNLYWSKGVISLDRPELGEAISSAFVNADYETEVSLGSIPSGGSLQLKARLKNVKMNLCPRTAQLKKTKNATLVEVQWSLFDPVTNETLAEVTTKGSHNALDQPYVKDGISLSFEQAMAVSANNLVASKDFVEHIKPGKLSELKANFKETLDVEYLVGDGSDRFHSIVKYLKNNSVIVKTTDGHGSGVLINDQGYVLTNAHVVGNESTFKVLIGADSYDATLTRKEQVRDVAIIKIKDYDGSAKGVKFAKHTPQEGAELFVIGAPLKVEFQHTITKGILSAKRNVSGLPYYQTDASINPGNSGGPVFDASGELIALTVSGMFTRGGASLNINYLIPIDDAIDTLNLSQSSIFSTLAKQLEGKTLLERGQILLDEADSWLNEPLTRLF